MLRPGQGTNKKLAKDLVAACRSESAEALLEWATKWIERLARLQGLAATPELRVSLDPRIAAVEGFARRKLLPDHPARRPCALADAQFVIARAHGFSSWPAFAAHVEALTSRASAVTEFEHAADAIINGDIAGLERRLRADPAWS